MIFTQATDVPILIRRATLFYHRISAAFPNDNGAYQTSFQQSGLGVDVSFEPADETDKPIVEAWGHYSVKRRSGKPYLSGVFPIFYREAYDLGLVSKDDAVNEHERLAI